MTEDPKNTKAVVKRFEGTVALAGQALAEMAEVAGPEGLKPTDLEVIGTPAAKSKSFDLFDGPTATLEGVIIYQRYVRKYYPPGSAVVDGVPPTCASVDGFVGVSQEGSDLGGDCLACPMAEFGTAQNDSGEPTKGQACSAYRQLYMMREGINLPSVLIVSPASLKFAKAYLQSLVQRGLHCKVTTVVSINSGAKNDAGTTHSTLIFNVGERIDDETSDALKAFGEKIKAMVTRADRKEASEEAPAK